MLNWTATTAISLLLAANLFGQSPAPSSAPTTNSPAAAKSPAPSPSATPSTEQIINSLGESDLQAAVALLKSNFTNPEAITDAELNRATLEGLMVRMPGGLMLLPGHGSVETESAAPFYSEVFEGHIGYLRLGALNSANLKEMDKHLQDFAAKKTLEIHAGPPAGFPALLRRGIEIKLFGDRSSQAEEQAFHRLEVL